MQFKQFIIEATQLVRRLQSRYLGNFGWWNVYFSPGAYSPNLRHEITRACNEAQHRLAAIGFGRSRQNIIVTNLSQEKNAITGGGVGGSAHYQEHGILLGVDNINANTIVHEHAHMVWKQLPAANKKFFINWYETHIGKFKSYEPDEDTVHRTLMSNVNMAKLVKKLMGIISNDVRSMSFDAHNIFGQDFSAFFASRSNVPKWLHVLLPRHGAMVRVKLKDNIRTSYNYEDRVLPKGTVVSLEYLPGSKASPYVINFYDGHKRFETNIAASDINSTVKVDDSLLTPEQHKLLSDHVPNQSASAFLGNPKRQEQIGNWFWKTGERISRQFNPFNDESQYFSDPYGKHGYSVEQVFNVSSPDDFYDEWVDTLGYYKIDSIQEIYKAADEVFQNLMRSMRRIIEERPAKMPKIPQAYSLDKPEASVRRDLAHKLGHAPSPYAAANPDELWAVSIEKGSRNISPELKKAVIATITGDIPK